MLIYRCIFGGNTPGIWVVEGKIGTRVNTPTFYKFFNGQKRARIRLSFTCEPRNREVFELQTVLQSVREFARSLQTGCTGKKFVWICGVYLVWTVQGAFLKRSEQEKQCGEGVRSESRRNSYNQWYFSTKALSGSFRDTRFWHGKPYEWFILIALVNIRRSIT